MLDRWLSLSQAVRDSTSRRRSRLIFWRAGYFVVRAVPFRLNGDDVTDIDLWVYERPAALTRRRLIVDAKNRRSSRVSERIISASGLRVALTDSLLEGTGFEPGVPPTTEA